MRNHSTLISLRIPNEMLKMLNSISDKMERPRTFILKKAIEKYLDEYVDYQIALDRLQDKDDTIISSKEMRRRVAK
ncbi:MAG: DNA-binding protein [bacterium]|nr:DNA-binding protein [bacterium]